MGYVREVWKICEAWEKCGLYVKYIWEICGRYVGGMWEMLGKYRRYVEYGRNVEYMWNIGRRYVEVWDICGR